jgi:hypothetical protein
MGRSRPQETNLTGWAIAERCENLRYCNADTGGFWAVNAKSAHLCQLEFKQLDKMVERWSGRWGVVAPGNRGLRFAARAADGPTRPEPRRLRQAMPFPTQNL